MLNDYAEKIQTLLCSNNQFEVGAELMALDSDQVDDENCVTCERNESS